jgi:penicillin V acylase-like amidase (Ntn superfamily)
MAIIGVSPNGALTVLGTVPTVKDAHCVTTDERGNAYVCDPRNGQLLVVHDPYPPQK